MKRMSANDSYPSGKNKGRATSPYYSESANLAFRSINEHHRIVGGSLHMQEAKNLTLQEQQVELMRLARTEPGIAEVVEAMKLYDEAPYEVFAENGSAAYLAAGANL
jgi:hypothetical protein